MKLEIIQKMRKFMRLQLVLLVLWIPCIILIFKFIPNRQYAGLVAGAGFLIIPFYNIGSEWIGLRVNNMIKMRIISSILFVIISALPIFLLRVFNWNIPFDEIQTGLPLSGRDLHSLSNYIYILMLLIYAITAFIEAFKENKP